MDALDLVLHICKRPSKYRYGDTKYDNADMTQIQQHRHRLYKVVGEYGTFRDNLPATLTRQGMLAQLYRFAALIYMNRALAVISPSSFSHRRLVREGIWLLRSLASCETAWPLFILACEADTDELRLQILDILSATMEDLAQRSNHIPLVRHIIEAIWKQNDLDVDSSISYVEMLDAVISTAPYLPLFA